MIMYTIEPKVFYLNFEQNLEYILKQMFGHSQCVIDSVRETNSDSL